MVDQRFDPAYQRGFTGTATEPRSLHLQAAAPAQALAAAPLRAEPIAAGPIAAGPVMAEPIAAPPLPEHPQPVMPVTAIAESQRGPRGPNPWVVALWIIGLGLIALAAYGWTYTLDGYMSYSDTGMTVEADNGPRDPLLFQFFSSYTPWLAQLGALTLLGLIFRLALRRDRRTSPPATATMEG